MRQQRHAQNGLVAGSSEAGNIFKCFVCAGVAGQHGNLFVEDSPYHGLAELDF